MENEEKMYICKLKYVFITLNRKNATLFFIFSLRLIFGFRHAVLLVEDEELNI